MMKDWLVSHNYGIQTGDCSYAFKYIKKMLKNTVSTSTSRAYTSAADGLSMD